MKQKTKKQVIYWFSVIVVGIALGLALQFVRAWTEPAQAPPGGNLGAPINTGAQNQTKQGGITARTLTAATVTGTTQLCIGTDCRTTWPSGGGSYTPCQCYVATDWYGTGAGIPPGCIYSLPDGYYPCGTIVTCWSTGSWLCYNSQWITYY